MSNPAARFDPVEFLELADRLSQGITEGDFRSAVSRAYYAIFLRARENLTAANLITPTATGGDHRLVVRTLKSQRRVEGNQLDRLRRRRNLADYNISISVSQADAGRVVQVARALWARL